MRRDPDLLRAILFEIEKHTGPERGLIKIQFEEYSKDEVSYHIGLLTESGLVHAQKFSGNDRVDWHATGLTNAGHEFIEAARNETVWNQAKAKLEKAGGFALPVALELLMTLGKQYLIGP